MTFRSLRTSTSSALDITSALPPCKSLLQHPFRLLLSILAFGSLACSAATPASAPMTPAHQDRDFGKVPLSFEPNRGQVDSQVQFLSRGQGYALYLTPGEAVLQLQKPTAKETSLGKDGRPVAQPAPETSTLRMSLVGADAKAAVAGQQPLPGRVNYFTGSDSSKWHTALPTYQRVSYKAVYPGIDLVYYGNQRELEYDFVVAPFADPAKIALQFTGATPRLNKAGDLVLSASVGETFFHKPVVYQFEGDRKVSVEASYRIADGKVGFALDSYDRAKPLVIDPILSYVTYLGGSSNDQISGVAVDSNRNVIVVGTAYSMNFPLQNPVDSVPPRSDRDTSMFVTKFNPTGTAVVYSTYLGVSTQGHGVAVDSTGNAYVVGETNDPTYPVTSGAFQNICGASNNNQGIRVTGCSSTSASGNNSGMLTKLSPDGQTLVYSTFLSGNNANIIRAVAVNAAGEAYVTGVTNAYCPLPPYNPNGTGFQAYSCFPTTANAVQNGPTHTTSDTIAFITKFNATGSGLLYSSLYGNLLTTGHYVATLTANAIAVDSAGDAYITGHMDTQTLVQTTAGAFQTARLDNALPAYVAKFHPTGDAVTSLAYGTYLGGLTTVNNSNNSDIGNAITVDAAGNAIVTGYTNSCLFPTTAGSFNPTGGGFPASNNCANGFLTKLNASGSGLVWSTFTGSLITSKNNDNNDVIALAPDGSIYVAGDQIGVVLSPTVNPIMTQNESHFTYIKRFDSTGASVLFSSAVGGTTDANSLPTGIAVDSAGNVYLGGYTDSYTFPVTAGAFQTTNKTPGPSVATGFVVKIAPTATTTTALTLPTGTVTAGQSVTFSAKVTGPTGSTGTPTGTVTFLSGSTTLGTGTLDATGSTSYTAPGLNATTYNVTASYAGDNAFSASVSAAQSLVVSPATPSVTLTAPSTALVGASVTLSATVTGTGGTPTGTITFKDGTTTLGTAPLAAGKASFTAASLTAGPHSITASYGGDSLFAAATSTASTVTINVPAAITFAALPTSLTITHGASGTTVITATPVGGYTGSVTFACGTLPAGASCSFAPATLTFTGNNTAASTTLTVSTATTTTALLESLPGRSSLGGILVALTLLPLGIWRRRNVLRAGPIMWLLLIVGSTSLMGLAGCGGSNSSNATNTPTTVTTAAGTYSVPVTITAGTAVSTLNLSVTVQ
jgi:hypothetical protein